MCNLPWSDPDERISGAGFTFGADILQQWNKQNGLELVASKSSSTHHGWIKLKS
jgi:hypothetical protein